MQHMTTMQESNLWNYSTDQEKTMCGCAFALFQLDLTRIRPHKYSIDRMYPFKCISMAQLKMIFEPESHARVSATIHTAEVPCRGCCSVTSDLKTKQNCPTQKSMNTLLYYSCVISVVYIEVVSL